jgi:MYXO-CTERM domain-containing protein
MTRSRLLSLVLLAAVCTSPRGTRADEGQWMPAQIAELDADLLARRGLELDAAELWGGDDGGLMRAVVNLSGCSAGFVSARGLVATNHHCAYRAIQANSSVEHDYLTDGFLAASPADELDSKGTTVQVLMEIRDVTTDVRKAADGIEEPGARARAVEVARKTLVDACEKEDAANRCRVAEFYNGSLYQLHRYVEFPDVRLVYAPPSAVGNYGGEVDNWMWPRHTGDFSLMRVYATADGKPAEYSPDNVPYVPARFLEPSTEGVGPGDFVAVLGFPGNTDRYLPTAEVRRQVDQFLPARVEIYGEWIRILEAAGARDPAVKIKVAATLRGLANRHKNARGMIDGIVRNGILKRREAEETTLAEWASKRPEEYGDVLAGLDALTAERRVSFPRDILVDEVARVAGSLAIAIDLVRLAREQPKPDLERAGAYQDRERTKLWKREESRMRDFDAAVETALISDILGRMEALPATERPTGVGAGDVAAIVARTQVTDPAFSQPLFDAADMAKIEASRDPMIALARDLVTAIEAREQTRDRQTGRMFELGPKYFEMLEAVRGGAVYPDANGTLRFSYASVQGYSPRDGLTATPQTTLAGQVAKHTGEDPFDLPETVRTAATNAATTYWSDPALGDVPVCFLSTADTTGGNSGSPVIDGKGRWVGLNFDRVWENIAGDFGYTTERSRNITVDVRYLLWTLDEVVGAKNLLEELGVTDEAEAGPRPRVAGSAAASEDAARAPQGAGAVGGPLKQRPPATNEPGGAPGCACDVDPTQSPSNAGYGLMAWIVLGRRRRRRQVGC